MTHLSFESDDIPIYNPEIEKIEAETNVRAQTRAKLIDAAAGLKKEAEIHVPALRKRPLEICVETPARLYRGVVVTRAEYFAFIDKLHHWAEELSA